MVASYGCDVFGGLRSGSPGTSEWLFTGEQRDADSGPYYLRARYYDPSSGRFLGRDPVPAVNLYAYVGNNPVSRVDPLGLRQLTMEGGGFVGGTISVVGADPKYHENPPLAGI